MGVDCLGWQWRLGRSTLGVATLPSCSSPAGLPKQLQPAYRHSQVPMLDRWFPSRRPCPEYLRQGTCMSSEPQNRVGPKWLVIPAAVQALKKRALGEVCMSGHLETRVRKRDGPGCPCCHLRLWSDSGRTLGGLDGDCMHTHGRSRGLTYSDRREEDRKGLEGHGNSS